MEREGGRSALQERDFRRAVGFGVNGVFDARGSCDSWSARWRASRATAIRSGGRRNSACIVFIAPFTTRRAFLILNHGMRAVARSARHSRRIIGSAKSVVM